MHITILVRVGKRSAQRNSPAIPRRGADPCRRTAQPIRPQARIHSAPHPSPVIKQPPHRAQPQPRHAVRLAAYARDQPAPLELFEQAERTIAQHVAVAGEAVRRDDAAGVGTAAVPDAPARCQRVEHALFVSGNVHGGNARQSKERLRRRAGRRGA